MTATAQTAAGWSRPVALTVAAAFFLEQIDGTILATALPAIARDLGVRPGDAGLAMTAYLITVAACIPVSGWLSERFGGRRVFLVAVAGFVAASVLCGLSSSLAMLVAGRVVQGVAGAMMVPVGRFIVLAGTAKADLVRAVAYLTWPALAAPVIAPFLGGVITQYAGWPWIFFVNVPLGAVLLAVAWRVIPAADSAADSAVPAGIDVRTLLLVMAGTVGLVVGLELVADTRRLPVAAALLAVAALGLGWAVRRARRVPTPLLDLRSFARPTFRAANTGGVAYRVAVNSVPFLLPLLLQDGFGWSPVEAGLMVMWVFVGNLAIKPVTTPLLRALGFRALIAASSAGLAATMVVCALVTPQTPVAVMAAVFLLSGVFRSVGYTGYNTMQFADVPAGQMNGASTLSSTVVQLANGLGIALAAVTVRAVDAVAHPAAPSGLLGYRVALVALAVVAVLSTVALLRLPPGAADHVRHPRRERAAEPAGPRTTRSSRA
ncbi:MFS transporter [Dactylosporangium sp. AC04546]|uniref:MFS transporter n=1 Tax=Dactylosporangium sp. AC04546 TaxID=2862460 RepID=UPI001EDD2E02|nr:MFS transporter [Dactylosporangium sp. AC04546]WVK78503.1 MFS transporter [Dactylosporangium sp. AC04546]